VISREGPSKPVPGAGAAGRAQRTEPKGAAVTSDDILRRLQRLEDRAELRELVNRYCFAVDDGDWAGLLEMFTDQAELPPAVGRDEVVGLLRSIRSTYGRTIHAATGQTLSFADDDHATGVVAARAELDIAGQTVLCQMRCLDGYEREGGVWRFSRRSIRFSYAQPWAAMAASMTADRPVHWPGTEAAPAGALREVSPA
jgi:SnoaL-like domain